jgi:hypothetical protein
MEKLAFHIEKKDFSDTISVAGGKVNMKYILL